MQDYNIAMAKDTLFKDLLEDPPEKGRIVSVLVPYPVDKAYSYRVPDDIDVQNGSYVTVPLGNREVTGVVWDSEPDAIPSSKIKNIISAYDLSPMSDAHRAFIDWTAQYNMAPKGFVLKMSLSAAKGLEEPKPVTAYAKNSDISEKMQKGLSDARKRVLAVLEDGRPRRTSELADMVNCSAGVIRGMLTKNLVKAVDIHSPAPCLHPKHDRTNVTLSPSQENAATHIKKCVADKSFQPILLDGVTGAGKTEVYFEAVAEALKQNRQALILLPEIALSNAFLERFKQRFDCAPALWHSALTSARRRDTWRGIAKGQTKVVVGARSALFLPYQDLGLIIVDEEHDPAYKQEDGVIYNARDMAIIRGQKESCPIVLVSATPSLETISNAWAGRYDHLHLPSRHGGASLPDIHLVDMKEDKPDRQHFLSSTLKKALSETLEKGQQSLLFLNRRGYAPLTLCRTCGHRIDCPRCTAWLVEHRKTGRLHCHHCGYDTRIPKDCPTCGDHDSLTACGPGVERIEEEVHATFPDARTVVLASDQNESQDDLKAKLAGIHDGAYDIIVGTQIIAKGHHFANLTCVGVVDADLGLQGGDLRAAERTYQLLHQVAGRAGREAEKGHVYLQTYLPENKVMQAMKSHDRDVFLDIEAHERESAKMPPYARLAGIIVAGKDEQLVLNISKAIGRTAPQGPTIQTLGPADAPLYRLRGNYRRRLLIRADKNINIQKAIAHWLKQHKIPSTVRVHVDIDPQSFL